MRRKLFIPVAGDNVAPRLDLAREGVLATMHGHSLLSKSTRVTLAEPLSTALHQLIVDEQVTEMVCGGIEEGQYDFLVWKKVKVFDGVIGCWRTALSRSLAGTLKPRQILDRPIP